MNNRITFHCPVEVAERINKICSEAGLSRSKLIFKMVSMMVIYLESTEKMGIIHWGLLIRSAKKGLIKEGRVIKGFNK